MAMKQFYAVQFKRDDALCVGALFASKSEAKTVFGTDPNELTKSSAAATQKTRCEKNPGTMYWQPANTITRDVWYKVTPDSGESPKPAPEEEG